MGEPLPPLAIPFRARFREAISEGRKTATTRTKRYGWPGSVLLTSFEDIAIELTDVYQQTLRWVADHLWQEEGVASPDEFVAVWRSLHRGAWDDHRTVWVHRFKVVPYRVPLSTALSLSDALEMADELAPLPKPLTRSSSLKATRISRSVSPEPQQGTRT